MSALPVVYAAQLRATAELDQPRGRIRTPVSDAGGQQTSWKWNATRTKPLSVDALTAVSAHSDGTSIPSNVSTLLLAVDAIVPLDLVPYCWGFSESLRSSPAPTTIPTRVRALVNAIVALEQSDPLYAVFYGSGGTSHGGVRDGVAVVPVSNASLMARDAHKKGAHRGRAAAFEYRAPRVAHELVCADLRDDPSFDMVSAALAVQAVTGALPVVPDHTRAAFGPSHRPVAQPTACNDSCAAEVLVSTLRLPAIPVVIGRSLALSSLASLAPSQLFHDSTLAQSSAKVSLRTRSGFRHLMNNSGQHTGIGPSLDWVWGGELAALIDRVTWHGAWRGRSGPSGVAGTAAAAKLAWAGHTSYRAFGQQCSLVQADPKNPPDIDAALTEWLAAEPLFAPHMAHELDATSPDNCGHVSWNDAEAALNKTKDYKLADGLTEDMFMKLTQSLLLLRPAEFQVYPCCAAVLGPDAPQDPPIMPAPTQAPQDSSAMQTTNRARKDVSFAPTTTTLMSAKDLQCTDYRGDGDIVLLRSDWSGFGPSILSGSFPEQTRVEQNESLPVCEDDVATQAFLAARILTEAAAWGGLVHGDDAAFTHVVTDCHTGRVYACTDAGFQQHVLQVVLWGSETTGDGGLTFASAPCLFARGGIDATAEGLLPQAASLAAPQLQALLTRPLRPIQDMAYMATNVPSEWRLRLSATTVLLSTEAHEGAVLVPTGPATVAPVTVTQGTNGALQFSIGGGPSRALAVYLTDPPSQGAPVDMRGYPYYQLGKDADAMYRPCRGSFLPLHHGALGAWFVSADRKTVMRIDVNVVSADGAHRVGYVPLPTDTFTEDGMFDLLLSDAAGGDEASRGLHYALMSAPDAMLKSAEGKAVAGILLGRHDAALQTRQFTDNTAVVMDARNLFPDVTDMTGKNRGQLLALALGVTPAVPSKLAGDDPNAGGLSQRAIQVGAAAGGALIGGVTGAWMAGRG